jgi:DUF438 domain-containing protein
MTEHTCSSHTILLGEDVELLKKSLEPGHVIHTMICEHEKILGLLEEIALAGREISRLDRFPSDRSVFEQLRSATSHLIGAEPHHKREEEILFPALERRGVYGPPMMMREEHKELRSMKTRLGDLAASVSEKNFQEFKGQLEPVSRRLVTFLQNHIDKENHVLYPMALQVISAKEDWARMRLECDRIGYCCFTPKT